MACEPPPLLNIYMITPPPVTSYLLFYAYSNYYIDVTYNYMMINVHNTLEQWTTFKMYLKLLTLLPPNFFIKSYTSSSQSEIVLTPPPSSFISLLPPSSQITTGQLPVMSL